MVVKFSENFILFSMKKTIYILIIIFITVLSPFKKVISMQSNNYKIEKDSINFGGTDNGQSDSYKLSDTMGEIGTGESDSANYTMKAGYRQVVDPSLSFAVSAVDLDFGTMDTNIRYTTASGGAAAEPANGSPSVLTLSTNADNGAEITIRSANAGLNRSAPSSNTISATGPSTVAGGSESYAPYAKNASGLTIPAGFQTGGTTAVTTSDQTFITVAAPVSGGTVDFLAKAGISGSTLAGSYSDTVTLVATGKF